MGRFAVEDLTLEDRAFVESIEALHRRMDALKIAFPEGRKRMALDAMQAAGVALAAAAVKSEKC